MNNQTSEKKQIITDDDLDNIKPGCFNILTAPRGWGKTTFMFD